LAPVATIRNLAKLFVFPFFFLSLVPVGISAVLVLALIEINVGWRGYAPGIGADNLAALYFNGDVVGIVSLVLIGGPVFWLLSLGLVRLDGLRSPSLVDHLRQCAYLYASVGMLVALFAAEYDENLVAGNPMHEAPNAAVLWVIAGFALLVNALTLSRRHRRIARVRLVGSS
jgi:hypothetical protein